MNIKKKYINLSLPVKASMWFMIASIFQKGISLLSTPIFTRMLSTEQYGTVTLYQSWYSMLFIFGTLNIAGGVYNNGLIKFSEEKDEFTSAILGLSLTTTMILFAIYFSFKNFWNNFLGLSTLLILIMFFQMLFEPSFLLWSSRKRFDYKFKKVVALSVVISLFSPLIGVITIFRTSYKIEARIISFALVQTTIFLFIFIYSFYKGKIYFSKKFWNYAFKISIPLIPHYLAMSALNQFDRIMISNFIDKDSAAIYSVAYSISMLLLVVTSAINNSLIPYIYKSINENKVDQLSSIINKILVFVATLCLIVMLLGPDIIRIVATKEYYKAIWVIPPVTTSVFYIFLYNIFGTIEFYYEKTKFVMFASIIGALANILLNFIFLPIFGFIAAGYTTLFCYILFAVMHYLFCERTLKNKNLEKLYCTKNILFLSVFILLIMIVVPVLYTNDITRYLTIIFFCLILLILRKKILNMFPSIFKSKNSFKK